MKREEIREIPMSYVKEDADKVMDAMEARIKELVKAKRDILTRNVELIGENAQLTMQVRELEATISKMETTQKWNSVKNGVPTHNRAVAIFPPFKGCEFACYNEFECCWDTEDGDDYLCDLDEVEKWFEIPLPTPTTEESSDVEKEK